MKFQFPLAAPRRADRTVLPALLATVLAALLITQFFVQPEGDLPAAPAAMVRNPRLDIPAMPPSAPTAPILARPLFAPRTSMSAGGVASQAILGGATVAGTVTIRGRAFAVVRHADGRVFNLPLGGGIGGWRLVALGAAGAKFRKGGEQVDLAYGAAAITREEEESESDEE